MTSTYCIFIQRFSNQWVAKYNIDHFVSWRCEFITMSISNETNVTCLTRSKLLREYPAPWTTWVFDFGWNDRQRGCIIKRIAIKLSSFLINRTPFMSAILHVYAIDCKSVEYKFMYIEINKKQQKESSLCTYSMKRSTWNQSTLFHLVK